MLTEKQLQRYADVLLWGLSTARKQKYKSDDIILVRYHHPAIRLAEIIHSKIIEMEMHPVLRCTPNHVIEQNFFEKANENQLIFNAPGEKELCKNLNGGIYLRAPESLTHLKGIQPEKISKNLISKKPFRDIIDKREDMGHFGWTLCSFPTQELANQAGMSLKNYTNQIVKACYLGKKNAVECWQAVYKDAKKIKSWINRLKIKSLHVESQNIDLVVTPGEKRQWVGISGHNIPSFEIFTSPDWRGTKGVYYSDQPSYRSGNYVEKVRIEFKNGKAVNVSAEQGEEFVNKQLKMDPGACRIGEFSLTDKRFSQIDKFMADTLFDENFGGKQGNCHIAVGSSYSESYKGDVKELSKKLKKELGFNDSALHWDLVNTEKKTVTATLDSGRKKLIYENGMFNINL